MRDGRAPPMIRRQLAIHRLIWLLLTPLLLAMILYFGLPEGDSLPTNAPIQDTHAGKGALP